MKNTLSAQHLIEEQRTRGKRKYRKLKKKNPFICFFVYCKMSYPAVYKPFLKQKTNEISCRAKKFYSRLQL